MLHSKSELVVLANGLYGTRIPSPRQHQVIALVAQGLKNSEVAEVTGTTEYVVKNHLRIIFDKLGSGIGLSWRSGTKPAGLAYEEPDRIWPRNLTSSPTYWSR
jgi:DNA-binding CsgD family transcriptional regulator